MSATIGIEAASERSDLVGRALAAAREAHAGQQRRHSGEPTPFLDHLLAVGDEMCRDDHPPQTLAAALLHDAVESGGMGVAEVRESFGGEVAALVEALTEREGIEAYEERKEELRRRVAAAGSEAQAIYAADKLANVRALREGYAREGEQVEREIGIALDLRIQIWEADLEMLFEQCPEAPVVARLAAELAALWGDRAAAERG